MYFYRVGDVCGINGQLFSVSVTSYESRFLLPALPETPYTLNDVIILPENKDFVETTVLSRQPASVLTLVNVTRENGFQLGSTSTIQNASIESGLI